MTIAFVPVGDQFAIVDIEDLHLVLGGNVWHQCTNRDKKQIYAARGWKLNGKRFREKMHQLIVPGAEEVDHINGDTLDNRRSNLRPVTRMQNARNQGPKSNCKSGFRGVCFDNKRQLWKAEMGLTNKSIYIGRYTTAEEAARAYDEAVYEWAGQYARLNFPRGD